MISCSGVNWSAGSGALLRRTMAALLRDNWVRSKTAQLAHGPATAQSLGFVERAGLPVVDREASHKETIVGETGKVRANLPIPHTVSAELTRPDKTLALSASCVPIGYSASSAVSLGKLARNSRRTSRARLKRSLQWNTAILSAAPLHPETFHRSFICPLNLGARQSGAQIPQARILSGSSVVCKWPHFLQETGIHVENEASHRDVF